MTDEQKKMIDKLNEDNRKLNDVNKGMKDYASCWYSRSYYNNCLIFHSAYHLI
jgi:hypothetical protein